MLWLIDPSLFRAIVMSGLAAVQRSDSTIGHGRRRVAGVLVLPGETIRPGCDRGARAFERGMTAAQ
jgi:acetyltransferase-like isoleucine patch superfamily enzyme